MTTFLLVPGGGCDPSCWRFVVDELDRRGHRGIAVDLPCEDDSADLDAYADAVVAQHRDDGEPPVVVALPSVASPGRSRAPEWGRRR